MQAEFQVGDRVKFWNAKQTRRIVGRIAHIPEHGRAAFIEPEGQWSACWREFGQIEAAEPHETSQSAAGS